MRLWDMWLAEQAKRDRWLRQQQPRRTVRMNLPLVRMWLYTSTSTVEYGE